MSFYRKTSQIQYVQDYFEVQAINAPQAIAVISGNDHLTFHALNHRANCLAHYLKRFNVKPETLVGLCLERSLDLIVGLLAILKAGAAFVPLDTTYPKERLALMLENAQVPVLITQQSMLAALPMHSAQVICLDQEWAQIAQESSANLATEMQPDHLAYVIYTSGSTGQPKGVMIEHRSLTNFVQSASAAYGIRAGDRILQFASISFDAAIEEIFLALTQGATLVLRTPEMMHSVASFLEACRSFELTALSLPTAFWHKICAELTNLEFPETIQLVVIGGELALLHWLEVWHQNVDNQVRLINSYGPTESTVVATCCELAGPQATSVQGNIVSIGKPLPNIQVYIFDANQQIVEAGTAGELYISGLGLARGYLNQPELTASKFISITIAGVKTRLYKTGDQVRLRADGHLEFITRIDHREKIRGFLVELNEVETVLAQHPDVSETVVITKENDAGDKQLIAYVIQDTQAWKQHYLSNYHQLETEQIEQWRLIHNDDRLNPAKTGWDDTFNISGWISSYTGALIPDTEMQEWVDNTIARILDCNPQHVLEIGCGTGLILFRIAPHCASYLGTDFSSTALQYIQQQLNHLEIQLPQVSLEQRPADNFQGLQPQSLDTVIINSVIQYFPSIGYLLNVLGQAVSVLKPGGVLFVGDVRNYLLLEAFATVVELSQAPENLSVGELRQLIQKRIFQEEELTIDPAFFLALQQRWPQITQVQILLKRGKFANELTQFRYDVVIRIGAAPRLSADYSQLNWKAEKLTISELRSRLKQTGSTSLMIQEVSNARLSTALRAVQGLYSSDCPKNVEQLKQQIDTEEKFGVDPEEFWQLAEELGYKITVDWNYSTSDGSYNVLFQPRSQIHFYPCLTQVCAPGVIKPWHTYANNPLQSKITQSLTSKLRTYLKQRLPEYMLPSAFVVLDALPLTPNGKINRRALPLPKSTRPIISEPFVAPETSLEKSLATLWSKILDIDRIGIYDSFFEIGGNSLRLMQLMAQIENEYQVTIPLIYFFKQPTIQGLVQYLKDNNQPIAVLTNTAMSLQQLEAEAILDPAISIHNVDRSHESTPQAIFLTGATGFVGAYILYELLQQTDATIYCLIRGKSLVHVYQKLYLAVEKYLPGIQLPVSRIKPVVGDLAKPLLGLKKREFEKLATTIDIIYHCGANVNLLYPYSSLRAVNVFGTKSVLQLATYTKMKPIHYISTLDVFEPLARSNISVIYEQDSICQGREVSNGYAQSKWVAEQLISQAMKKGLPACIYRLGMITGHHQSGVSNPDDLVSRLLTSFIQLKCAPDVDWSIDMTPVDYISKAIIFLSLKSNSLDQAFHLFNPQPVSLDKLIRYINIFGYPVSQIKYQQWKALIRYHQNSLNSLAKTLTEPIQEKQQSRLEFWLSSNQTFDCQNTTKGLYGSGISCPKVGYNVVEKYLIHLLQKTPFTDSILTQA